MLSSLTTMLVVAVTVTPMQLAMPRAINPVAVLVSIFVMIPIAAIMIGRNDTAR